MLDRGRNDLENDRFRRMLRAVRRPGTTRKAAVWPETSVRYMPFPLPSSHREKKNLALRLRR